MSSGNGNQVVPNSRPVALASGRRPTMIKGLTPSLPERGKIKIGMKGAMMRSRRGREFQPPQKLDHFVVTTLERGADGNFVPDAALMARLGDKPTEIPVRLLYDDPTLNFPTRLACFIGRTLWCAGDGEYATRLTERPEEVEGDRVELRPRQVECPCFRQDPAYPGRDKCKMNGSLNVLIDGAGGLGGVWKFRTTSFNSIVGIMSSLNFLKNITGGVLANIPLKLKVRPQNATSPTDGGQLTIYVVTLSFDGEPDELQEIAHTIALRRATAHVSIEHIEDEARRALALLPPANVPLPGDVLDDVTAEFYPEQVGAPEPEREPGGDVGLHREEELDPEFTVIDNDSNSFELGRERAIKAIHAIFTDAQRFNDHARMAAAWANNRVTIERLTQEGAAAEAAALTAYYAECRDRIPVRVHRDAPETSEAEDGPLHAPPLDPPPQRPAQADPGTFPGDLPLGQRLVPRDAPGVESTPSRPPPREVRSDNQIPTDQISANQPANDGQPAISIVSQGRVDVVEQDLVAEAPGDPGEPLASYLIPPTIRGGKEDWRTWAKVLFLPKLKQTFHHLEFFWGDNLENIEKAKAVLPANEYRELIAAKDAQWEIINRRNAGQG